MPYVINFLVETLPILTYDLGSTDQATDDITTCMSMFMTNFGPLFMTKTSQNTCIINFHCESDGRSKAVEVVNK
jgi:hypothetical protein